MINMSLIIETFQQYKTFELSGCRDYDRGIRNVGFLIDLSSTNVRLSIVTLSEELKLTVIEIEVFKYW